MAIHTYDIIMPGLLILMTLRGLWKGLIHQVASLLSAFLSLWVAIQYADRLAPYVGGTAPTNQWVAMLILYVATAFLVWLISGRVTAMLHKMKLGGFDHQMGAILGLCCGVVLCMVITFFVVTLSEQGRQMVLESRSGYWAARILENVDQILPEKSQGYLAKYIEQFREELGQTSHSNQTDSVDKTAPDGSTSNEFRWPQWTQGSLNTNPVAPNTQNGVNTNNAANTSIGGNVGTGNAEDSTDENSSGMAQLFNRFRNALGQSIYEDSAPASSASSVAGNTTQSYTTPSWW